MTTRKALTSPRVTVDVTRTIIETAIREDSGHCMIADAVKLAYPGARSVSVDIQTIRFSDPAKGLRYTYLTPRRAQLALLDFDMGEQPEAFQVQLRRAHVTVMRSHRNSGSRELTEEHRDKLRANVAVARGEWNEAAGIPSGKTIADGGHGKAAGDDPIPAGGNPPPMGALAHGKTGRHRDVPRARRRAFGLRAMDRYSRALQDSRDDSES